MVTCIDSYSPAQPLVGCLPLGSVGLGTGQLDAFVVLVHPEKHVVYAMGPLVSVPQRCARPVDIEPLGVHLHHEGGLAVGQLYPYLDLVLKDAMV